MQSAHLDLVVGLANLGAAGQDDDGPGFDPTMEREAAEALIATFRDRGLEPPATSVTRPRPRESLRAALERSNALLAGRNLPTHAEPDEAPPWQPSAPRPLPVGALYRLRRVLAHLLVRPSLAVEPLAPGADARDDPVMAEVAARVDCHLIQHADREGFYLPLQISRTVHDPTGTALPGGWLGSSLRLAEEMRRVAPALGIGLGADGYLPDDLRDRLADGTRRAADPFGEEKWAWLLHMEAAEASVRDRLAIVCC